MTPTIGWIMTVVALIAITAFWLSTRRSKHDRPDKPDPGPTPRETVKVSVEEGNCEIGTVAIDPWHVSVTRGKPLKWDFIGPPNSKWTMGIEVDDQGNWPFPAPPPKVFVSPGGSIPAGNVNAQAPLHTKHKYMVVLKCDERTVRIDPEIYIYT